MSQLSAEDEAELQTLLRQLLRGVKERISGAPSIECAEEILLHLEETDKNFHNYEFVKYLRQYVESSLGGVSEEETEKCARGDGHATGSGQDTLVHAVTRRVRESPEYDQMLLSLKNAMMVVVESLIDRFEEDLVKKEEMQQLREGGQQHDPSSSHYTDNCSDSDSSFNQSYAFIKQEQLQVLAEKLDPSKPREVRWEALQALCFAPPSDVLSCESWSGLRRNLSVALADPDPDLSDKVLRFFAKTFSSSPLSVTREIYSSLAKSIETNFLLLKISLPIGSAGIDVTRPDMTRLLKQLRLMNDFQKEVPTFWIRHPEKYMEEIIESTFSLLSVHSQQDPRVPPATDRPLQPVHLLALLDVRAAWFNKWMHGNYSRTVVFRLLERTYKSLVASALQQCILYQEACEQFKEEPYSPPPHNTTCGVQRTVYSGRELQYAHFVHSVCVLGKILMYSKGRNLFPISIRGRKESVGLTDIVVILINIMYQHPTFPNSDAPTHTDSLCPTGLITGVLRTLSDRTECAVECLYQTPVIETLLAPVIALLNGHQAKLKSPGSRLTHVADTLACIAATDQGRSLFLNERNVSLNQGESTTPAHVIVQFTQRLLGGAVPALSGLDSSTTWAVCGAFTSLCRQMYHTWEGLQALGPYALHSSLALAWKKVSCLSERALTPVPGAIPESSTQEAHNNVLWEETLLDNLLNFAATPKGLLLLQQTGAIDECASYMFSRFTKKLQVSRCEKFGYGVLVSQLAATAPGVAALHASGFVQALVVELWSCLECGREEVRVVQPRPTPMEPIDRNCLKSFLSLVTLLSAAQSVWELLGGQPLPNRTDYSLREVPTSIPDLIDRLIAVDSDVKIHSLFNYEQSHTFGLRLLSVLCCNLDSLLLLEAQYDLSSLLLRSLEDNILPSSSCSSSSQQREFIVDGLSVERNQVLVRAALVGGPSERRLPPRELQKGEEPYPWPMFSAYPVPAYYSLRPPKTTATAQDSQISEFLASSSKASEQEESWMDTCRSLYCQTMTTRPDDLTGPVLANLLEKVVSHLSSSSTGRFFPPSAYQAEEESQRSVSLSSVQQLGVHTCCRYGRYLELVSEHSEPDLSLLLKHCQRFLSKERASINSKLSSLQGGYPGHDWLVSTVFLLLAGDWERCVELLLQLSTLLTSAYVWPARIHASVHLPLEVASSGIGPVFWCTAHYVEMLLKSEVPLVSSAFKMSGFTASQMCLQWLGQCWWNYLDWPEISHYLSTCVVMGADYQVYVCVAVLKHLQPHILRHTQAQDLQVYLKEEPIQGFRVSNYLEYMQGLEQRYRTMVLAEMKSITQSIS